MGTENVIYSEFICQTCGSKITLPRQRHRQREKGHIKDIYCVKCKDVTKHDEIRIQDFTLSNIKGEL